MERLARRHPDTGPGAGQVPGFLTRGIESRDTYYYRRLFTDAVRAVEAARSLAIDPERIAVFGISQGGGISLAVAGLVPGLAHVVALMDPICPPSTVYAAFKRLAREGQAVALPSPLRNGT